MNSPLAKSVAKKIALASVLYVALGTSALHAEDISKSFEVSAGGTLDLRTDVGSIEIQTHSRDTVLLEVETSGRDADEFEVSTDVSGDSVEIRGKVDRGSGWGNWGNNLKVKFYVTVPENYDLDLQTSGGSISIEDLVGKVDAQTSGGSIRMGNIEGDVDVHTSGGSITSKSVYGNIDAHTSGGSIKVTFAKDLTDDASLTTSGGSITAYLHEDISVDLDASTSGGRVRTDFDVDGRVKKKSIRGEINGGGHKLVLRTSGGSVNIKEL